MHQIWVYKQKWKKTEWKQILQEKKKEKEMNENKAFR